VAGYIFHSLLQMTACTRQVWALCICPHLLHEFDGSMSLVQYLTNASEVAAVMTLLPFQLCYWPYGRDDHWVRFSAWVSY